MNNSEQHYTSWVKLLESNPLFHDMIYSAIDDHSHKTGDYLDYYDRADLMRAVLSDMIDSQWDNFHDLVGDYIRENK